MAENKKSDWNFDLNWSDLSFGDDLDEKQLSLKEASENPLFETEKTSIKNYRIENLQRIKKLSEVADVPSKNSHSRYVTYHSFNAYTWIDFFLSKFESFDEVYVTSYNFNEPVIELLFEHFDKGIFKKMSLVISESIRFRMPKRYFQLKSGIESRNNPNLKLGGVWNHSKITLLKPTNCDDYFVIEGSGNFSDNAFIEQYSVDNSEQIYNFHKNWMDAYVFDRNNINKKRHFIIEANG